MLIAISGKKQSGKSTLCEFFELNHKNVTLSGESLTFEKIDMAHDLKKMIVEIMGVDHDIIYGSDQDKNTATQYKWCDLPHYTVDMEPLPPYMTGRELMQQVGTEIFRRMNPYIWVNTTIPRICNSKADIQFSTDIRFPSEMEALKKLDNAIFIRLTKNVYNDIHESEVSLDPHRYDWSNFNVIIDNQKMTIEEKNACFLYALDKLEIIALDSSSTLFAPYWSKELRKMVKVNKKC